MAIFHYQHQDDQNQDNEIAVQIESDADGYNVTIGDKTYHVVRHNHDAHRINFSVDGEYKQMCLAPGSTPEERQIWLAGQQWQLAKIDPRRKNRRSNKQAEPGALTASMPGQVQEILIEEGATVKQGDTLLILEAMKMEMRVNAPHDGVVASINCALGDVVARGQALVVLS